MAKKAAPKKRIIKGRDFNEDKRQDGLRSAKSFGWRKAGTSKKPTKKEIKEHYDGASNGVYMENRPERGDNRGRAKKGERFEKGGSIDSSMNFHMNDYSKLLDADLFDSVKSGRVWDIKEIDGSKVYGKYNKEKGTLFIAGKKDLSNPLVVWLKDNSYMSSDNVDKLAKGGKVNAYANNGDLRSDFEKHQSADYTTILVDYDADTNEDYPYILTINDDSYFYASEKERDEDEKLAKKILKNKFAKGGKIDRAKSTKKTRVNRTKKAIAQDKNIKALHGGKRISESGSVYYENRENRKDDNRTKKFAKGGVIEYSVISDNEEENFDDYDRALDFLKGLDDDDKKSAQFFKKEWVKRGKQMEEGDVEVYKQRGEDFDIDSYSKGGDLKNYTSADLPKDGSAIEIHMPKMGKFPAEDIVLKYNQDNFAFDAYRNGELSGTRITEKQFLDNLNNGSYEFKNEDIDSSEKYYDTYGSVKGDGFDLYYYNAKTDDFDIYVDNFKTISEAKEKAEKEGYEKRPIHMRYEKGGKVGKNKLTYEIKEIPAYNGKDELVGSWYRIYDNKGRLKTLFTRYWLNSDKKHSITEVGSRELAEKILNEIKSGTHNEDKIVGREADYDLGVIPEGKEPVDIDEIKFAKGGHVSKGELVWKKLSNSDKVKFLKENFTPEITPRSQETLVGKSFNFLPKNVKIKIESVYANVEEYAKGGKIKLREIEDETVLMPYVIAEPIAETAAEITLKDEFSKWESLSKSEKEALDEKYKNLVDEISVYLVKRANTVYTHNKSFEKDVKGKKGREVLNTFMEHWCGLVDGKLVKPISDTMARYEKESKSGNFEDGGEINDEAKSYKINNTIALESELNKHFHDLKLKGGYSLSMGTFQVKLTKSQLDEVVDLIKELDKNDNVYILNSVNDVVYDSKKKDEYSKFEDGGSINIENQYDGHSNESVWNAWSKSQRSHFLLDHSELLDNDRLENNLGHARDVQKDKSYSQLTPHTKRVLEAHIEKGQYEKGGELGSYLQEDKKFNDYKKILEDKYGKGFSNKSLTEDEFEKLYELKERRINSFEKNIVVEDARKSKMEKGGEIKSTLTLSEIESKLGKTFGFWSVPYQVTVDGVEYRKRFGSNIYNKI
jgi:hypothetical protein